MPLIKRFKYQLFGVEIFAGFIVSEIFFNVEKLKQLFPHLSDIIWQDDLMTKMHDHLPLLLFGPENFVFLLETHNFVEASYFMPISLSILAFDGKNVSYSNRMFLLQTAFYFLVYYYDIKTKTKKYIYVKLKKAVKIYNFIHQKL